MITRFDLQTFPLEVVLRAEATYEEAEDTKDLYLDALLDFTLNGDVDTGFAVTPVVRWGPNFTVPSYESTLLYNGSVAPTTGPAATFYDGTIKAVNETSKMAPVSLAAYSKAMRFAFEEGGPGHGFIQRFRVVPIKATREAMDIVHDSWFQVLKETDLANTVPGFFCGIAFNAVTRTFAERSQGTPENIEVVPQFWVEESISFSGAENEAKIDEFLQTVNDRIESQLNEKDLAIRYI